MTEQKDTERNEDFEDFADLPRYLEETAAFDDGDDIFDLHDSDDPFFEVEETASDEEPSELPELPQAEHFEPEQNPQSRIRRSSPTAFTGVITGAALLAAGLVLMILSVRTPDFAAPFVQLLERMQLQPPHLVIVGLVLMGFGAMRRRQVQTQQIVDASLRLVERGADATNESLDQLYEIAEHQNNTQAASPDDVQCVLHMLQRQDEKIANLTRAIKMYGKPLMEITNQLSDTNDQVNQLSTALSDVHRDLESSRSFVEDMVRANPGSADSEALSRVLRRMGDDLRREIEKSIDQRGTGEDVQPAVEEMREAMNELRRELGDMRGSQGSIDLGPLAKETREAIDALREEFASRPATAAAGSSSDFEQPLRDVQDQIRSLETVIQKMAQAGPVAAAPAASPSPDSSKEPSQPTTRRRREEPIDNTDSDDRKPSGSGSKKTHGKNVMGAIEKLKKMRG